MGQNGKGHRSRERAAGVRPSGFPHPTIRNMTMNDFASWMQTWVIERPVVDRDRAYRPVRFPVEVDTGRLTGLTQFRTANIVVPPTNDNPNAPPNLYTAIQQQLGLKIETAKAPDAVLIDHIERPSAD